MSGPNELLTTSLICSQVRPAQFVEHLLALVRLLHPLLSSVSGHTGVTISQRLCQDDLIQNDVRLTAIFGLGAMRARPRTMSDAELVRFGR
jgi:hypothetical protein